MKLTSPIGELKGVGPRLAQYYADMGLKTAGDLLGYYPRRYEDYSHVTAIKDLKPGSVTIEAKIKHVSGRYVRRGMHITEAIAEDKSGSVRLIWFNQSYRAGSLKRSQLYYISGQYELRRQHFAIASPSVEMASDMPLHTARILAVYRESKQVSSRQLRKVVQQVLPLTADMPETLPDWLIEEYKLMSRGPALAALHAPVSDQELEAAKRRLGFEEAFYLMLASLINKRANQSERAVPIPFDLQLARRFVAHLPFQLTDAQRKATWSIYQDLGRTEPMNRLLEGDVGSGKTAVAAMAAVMALATDRQVVCMAPTELLARQHAQTFHDLLMPLGMADKVALLVGSFTMVEKTRLRAALKKGRVGFLVGTHALIQEKVDMHDLALVIIDEQQRFGVEQRKKLIAKAGHMPHVLSLSATPIPRSLALTIYGEMDISILGEKPLGRQPIVTKVVPPAGRDKLYHEVDTQLAAGRQMFVVCPLISGTEQEDNAAESMYERLSARTFAHRRVGLLHGRMKAADKTAVMKKFVRHELDILVTTTVIEVGVDVPNATIMLIEQPERFGLAQLHQLRGRVGRGQEKGYCYLVGEGSGPPSRRLRALETLSDGFKLAELDLQLRGPGAVYGTAQHGALDLRLVPLTDSRLLAEVRAAAEGFFARGEDLLHYRHIAKMVKKLNNVTNLN